MEIDEFVKDIEYKLDRAKFYDETLDKTQFIAWCESLLKDIEDIENPSQEIDSLREEIEMLEEQVQEAKHEAREIIQDCIDFLEDKRDSFSDT